MSFQSVLSFEAIHSFDAIHLSQGRKKYNFNKIHLYSFLPCCAFGRWPELSCTEAASQPCTSLPGVSAQMTTQPALLPS